MGCEDALQHLLNYLFPNIFEISPHVINAVMEGIEGLRVALGPGRILLYTLQGLFHPARRVRDVYWKIYNNMYLGAQDGLVAVYPSFPDDPKTGNTYRRYELELMMWGLYKFQGKWGTITSRASQLKLTHEHIQRTKVQLQSIISVKIQKINIKNPF